MKGSQCAAEAGEIQGGKINLDFTLVNKKTTHTGTIV